MPRTVEYTYDQSLLTSVAGYGSIMYHPMGQIAAVVHANGLTETITADDHGMARPKRISVTRTAGGATLWGSYTGAEVEAYANDAVLRRFLTLNLDILMAIQQGLPLTDAQLQQVQSVLPSPTSRQSSPVMVRPPASSMVHDVLRSGDNLVCYNGACF